MLIKKMSSVPHMHISKYARKDSLCEFQYFIVKLLEFYVHDDGSLIRDSVAAVAAAADEVKRGASLIVI